MDLGNLRTALQYVGEHGFGDHVDADDTIEKAAAGLLALCDTLGAAGPDGTPRPNRTDEQTSQVRIPYADVDDMSLNELIDVAKDTVTGYHGWSKWLEHHYDPAKTALVELLQEFDIIGQPNDQGFAEPCDRCGKPIPSNRDRSPNYCEECAVIVTAQGGDED
jgi:hypothetical protein